MKVLSTILFILFLMNAFGQYSVSTGVYHQLDNIGQNGYMYYFGKSALHRYNGLVLQGDFQKEFFKAYTELGYLASSFELIQSQHSGFGSSSVKQSTSKIYHSSLFFDTFTFKLGIGTQGESGNRERFWFCASTNLFFQYDVFNREMETDQVMYESTSVTNLTMNGWVTTEIIEPPDYTPYSLIEFSRFVQQFGAELKVRFGYKNYFIELSGSFSLMDQNRAKTTFNQYLSNYSLDQTSNKTLNTGIKIGYVISKKNKNLIPEG